MNTFGQIFKISIFGESHGAYVGIVCHGFPAGIPLEESDFLADLNRRKSGAKGTTPRKETDEPLIVSGLFNQTTTGTPLTILFKNSDTQSKDYSNLKKHFRPGHADFVANEKFYGFQDYRGGGHFSGRLTVCLVAAGVLAKKILPPTLNFQTKLKEVGGRQDIQDAIDHAMEQKYSIGGIIEVEVNHLPIGLGEPFFDSVESKIAQLVFAVPATKGVEFGSGFKAAEMKGSEHNDLILNETGQTETNFAGGINGGITNGNPLIVRVAIKPTSSVFTKQYTFNKESGKQEDLKIVGRHDVCIALRAQVVIESIIAIALADLFLIRKTQLNQ